MQAKYRNYTEQIIGYVIMLFVIIVFLVLIMNSFETKSEIKSVKSEEYIISTKVQP